MSDEAKCKISKKNKGRKPTVFATQKAIEKCSKPVLSIVTGKVYSSATEASKAENTPRNTITRHCRKEVREPKWKYLK